MKKIETVYEEPEMEYVQFRANDVVTTSISDSDQGEWDSQLIEENVSDQGGDGY